MISLVYKVITIDCLVPNVYYLVWFARFYLFCKVSNCLAWLIQSFSLYLVWFTMFLIFLFGLQGFFFYLVWFTRFLIVLFGLQGFSLYLVSNYIWFGLQGFLL